MGVEDAQHLLARVRKELLRVTRVGDGLALLRVATLISEPRLQSRRQNDALETDVTKASIGYVTNEDPPDLEDTLPLVRSPYSRAARIVNLKSTRR